MFFLLVLFAALTSAISLTESLVSIVADGTGLSRRLSLIICMVFIVVVGIIVNAGYNVFSAVQPLGEGSTILDFFDFVSNSVLMPIVAILTCIFVGWIVKPKVLVDEVKESSEFKAEKAWVVMVKYIAPLLVALILISNILPYIVGA